jgi:hypothetical protein
MSADEIRLRIKPGVGQSAGIAVDRIRDDVLS